MKYKKAGIICAVSDELAPYLPYIKDARVSSAAMLSVTEGTLCGQPVAAVFCGVCKVNAAIAAQVLIDRFGIDCLIMSGTSGGMADGLHIGDTVVVTELAYHDVADDVLCAYHPHLPDPYFRADPGLLELARALDVSSLPQKLFYGRAATGEQFIDSDGRAAINRKLAPLTVDMESAAAAHVCYANSIPFLAIRSVSDTEEEHGLATFEVNCARAARSSAAFTMLLLAALSRA